MATTQTLAKIERDDDLRSIWPREAQDFTPWLKEHIDELGEALGLELEAEAAEAPVGGFSLDILAREIGRDRPVIIENQLETTNHTHLGQLLTYAAGYDASVVVWVAKDFRDEHKAALDMLNRRTDEDTEFYGVVIELWRIANSPRALNFKVVSAPNEWGKQTKQATRHRSDGEVSGRYERYRVFFQGVVDQLRGKPGFAQRHQARPKSWYAFQTYGRGIYSNVSFGNPRIARVEVYIDSGDKDWNKRLFDKIVQSKREIEVELGGLVWERLDNRRGCRISAHHPGSIDDDEKTLQEVSRWMVETLPAFRKTFGDRIPELIESMGDLDNYDPDDELAGRGLG